MSALIFSFFFFCLLLCFTADINALLSQQPLSLVPDVPLNNQRVVLSDEPPVVRYKLVNLSPDTSYLIKVSWLGTEPVSLQIHWENDINDMDHISRKLLDTEQMRFRTMTNGQVKGQEQKEPIVLISAVYEGVSDIPGISKRAISFNIVCESLTFGILPQGAFMLIIICLIALFLILKYVVPAILIWIDSEKSSNKRNH